MKIQARELKKSEPVPFTIVVGGAVFCPCCGEGELYNPTAPVSEWRWRLRPNKVESRGVWWSECTDCRLWFGDDGGVEISDSVPLVTLARLRAKGYQFPDEYME